LTNDVAVTASGIVGLTWTPPNSDGGSPVIDYKISYKIATGEYSLPVTVLTTSYTASSLTAGVVYTFKVAARSSVGLGVDSSELNVRAAAIPGVPASPSTTVVSNTGVTITWVAPAEDGGSPITAYTVAIRQNDGTTFTTYAGCTGTTPTCTVPIADLQADPFTLAWGASFYAKVLATNVVGSSAASSSGDGVKITTYPDPPSSLANNSAVTSATVIGLTWVAPVFVGGTPVTSYTVGWD
jgi:titin